MDRDKTSAMDREPTGRRRTGGVIRSCAGLLALLMLALPSARADIVLLDEYWSPEILADDVVAEEVDAETPGDPPTAKTGSVSVRLTNARLRQFGWLFEGFCARSDRQNAECSAKLAFLNVALKC